MSKIESIAELVSMKEKVIKEVIGNENGAKAWQFIHKDSRVEETFEGIPIPRRPRPSK
jgi:hypothetical protein